MLKLRNIALFLLILGVPFGSFGKQIPGASVKHQASYTSSDGALHKSFPAGDARLFEIKEQAEWVLNAGNKLLDSLVGKDSAGHQSDRNTFSKSRASQKEFNYYKASKQLFQSLPIKKIIFPFHSFL